MKRDSLHELVRQRLRRLPPPFESHYGVVPSPPPDHAIPVRDHAELVRGALAAIAEMNAEQRTPTPEFYTDLQSRDEALGSCAIEDIRVTGDELEAVVRTGEGTPSAKLVREYWRLLHEMSARARTEGNSIFTIELLTEVHARLMQHDDHFRDEPGRVRKKVVWLGGSGSSIAESSWNPPPPDAITDCLEENLSYMRNDGMQQMTQNIIVRMAVAHAHFEAVHPYLDGNGRVGRFLLLLMSAADGHRPLFLSAFLWSARHRYYQGLKAAQQRLDWGPLVGLFAEAVLAQHQKAGPGLDELCLIDDE